MHDEAGHELIERHMLEQLREVAEYTRVVLINGPRQAGKTTLLQQLHAELGGWLRSLDVDVERASARADPEGYIMSAPRPTFLDEVQCAGDPLILADGREIDCILQTPDSRVVGVEVKASATVNVHDFRHLSFARDRLGDEFITGVLFYTGARALPFGDRLMALPINLLWNGQSVSSL